MVSFLAASTRASRVCGNSVIPGRLEQIGVVKDAEGRAERADAVLLAAEIGDVPGEGRDGRLLGRVVRGVDVRGDVGDLSSVDELGEHEVDEIDDVRRLGSVAGGQLGVHGLPLEEGRVEGDARVRGLEVRLHLLPELGVGGVMGTLDEGQGDVGLLRPAAARRNGSRGGQRVGDLAGKGHGDAGGSGAEHELAAVDEAVAEVDDGLVAQTLAIGEAQFAGAHRGTLLLATNCLPLPAHAGGEANLTPRTRSAAPCNGAAPSPCSRMQSTIAAPS